MRKQRIAVAELILDDGESGRVYVPIFDRIDRDIEQAEAYCSGDSVAKARQLSSRYNANSQRSL